MKSLKVSCRILFLTLLMLASSGYAKQAPPNIILIMADDLGYGDTGQYGAVLFETPNIDSLAQEGAQLTNFYASANVCTPSRAGLLTGRYAIRSGLAKKTLNVNDSNGLPKSEHTLAEQLQTLGYHTALIGKWHLGDQDKYWPTEHGFDEFFGTIHSNDVPDQPLYRNDEKVIEKINQQSLTLDFTGEALSFVEKNKANPFFLFLSLTAPHKPLIPSEKFKGKSDAGAYGDKVEELDWGVGKILSRLKQLNIDDNTLVLFTSDNGPFPQGSTNGLRGGKGTGWDGGYRVPLIARWPGEINAGTQSSAMAMNIDLLPTLVSIAGGVPGKSTVIDGKDISAVFRGSQQSPHDVLYFFNNERIAALRTQKWRLILSDYPPWRDAKPIRFEGNKKSVYINVRYGLTFGATI